MRGTESWGRSGGPGRWKALAGAAVCATRRAPLITGLLAMAPVASAPLVVGLLAIAPLAPAPLAMASPLAAQTVAVVGGVTDSESGAPLVGALVRVLDADGLPVGTARTDQDGRYQILFDRLDVISVRATALGYLATQRSLRWPADEELLEIPFELDLRPIEIDPIEVQGERKGGLTPGREIFREHRELGRGVFITAADIRAMQPRWLPDVLLQVEGLWNWPGPGQGLTSRVGRGKCLVVMVDGWTVQAETSRFLGFGPMVSRRTSFYDDWRLDVDPNDVAGIEVFPAYKDVPPDLQIDAYPCGLIAVWKTPAWYGPDGGGG